VTAAREKEVFVIQVRQLRKVYPGAVEAVKGIDFDVGPGEVFGLLGPNGAGKSTTIGMLTTTIRPSGGSARLAGFDVAREPLAARRVSSVVFQEPVVDRALSGRRNLEIHARLWGVEPRAAAEEIDRIAELMGLAELLDRPAGSYSGGERRRLELGRALVSRPRVLFLDEPTVGLDPRIREGLLDAIAALRERSELTILLTTHYLEEAERLCNRLAVMHEGRIVALGSPASLRQELGSELIELRVENVAEALSSLRGQGIAGDDAFAVGSRLTVPLREWTAGQAIPVIHELGLATSISARQPTLDDVYLRLTGDSLAQAA
jgi:ABC-2 type transport system ATP-binding protein